MDPPSSTLDANSQAEAWKAPWSQDTSEKTHQAIQANEDAMATTQRWTIMLSRDIAQSKLPFALRWTSSGILLLVLNTSVVAISAVNRASDDPLNSIVHIPMSVLPIPKIDIKNAGPELFIHQAPIRMHSGHSHITDQTVVDTDVWENKAGSCLLVCIAQSHTGLSLARIDTQLIGSPFVPMTCEFPWIETEGNLASHMVPSCVAWSPDGKLLACGTSIPAGLIAVWKIGHVDGEHNQVVASLLYTWKIKEASSTTHRLVSALTFLQMSESVSESENQSSQDYALVGGLSDGNVVLWTLSETATQGSIEQSEKLLSFPTSNVSPIIRLKVSRTNSLVACAGNVVLYCKDALALAPQTCAISSRGPVCGVDWKSTQELLILTVFGTIESWTLPSFHGTAEAAQSTSSFLLADRKSVADDGCNATCVGLAVSPNGAMATTVHIGDRTALLTKNQRLHGPFFILSGYAVETQVTNVLELAAEKGAPFQLRDLFWAITLLPESTKTQALDQVTQLALDSTSPPMLRAAACALLIDLDAPVAAPSTIASVLASQHASVTVETLRCAIEKSLEGLAAEQVSALLSLADLSVAQAAAGVLEENQLEATRQVYAKLGSSSDLDRIAQLGTDHQFPRRGTAWPPVVYQPDSLGLVADGELRDTLSMQVLSTFQVLVCPCCKATTAQRPTLPHCNPVWTRACAVCKTQLFLAQEQIF